MLPELRAPGSPADAGTWGCVTAALRWWLRRQSGSLHAGHLHFTYVLLRLETAALSVLATPHPPPHTHTHTPVLKVHVSLGNPQGLLGGAPGPGTEEEPGTALPPEPLRDPA